MLLSIGKATSLAREASASEIESAVDEANRIVWDNRPVSIRFVSQAEAEKLPLRKEPAREGTLRLIEVEDFDLSACGGTHVEATGAIGMIAVLAGERLRGGSRVTFVCGARALRALRTYRDAVAAARTPNSRSVVQVFAIGELSVLMLSGLDNLALDEKCPPKARSRLAFNYSGKMDTRQPTW